MLRITVARKIICTVLLIMSTGCWVSSEAADTTAKQGKSNQASAQNDGTLSSQAWAYVEYLITATTNTKVGGPVVFNESLTFDIYSRYAQWENDTKKALRETGIKVCADRPSDSRTWQWFLATIDYPPSYSTRNSAATDQGVDQGLAQWQATYKKLKPAFLAREDISDNQKMAALVKELRQQQGRLSEQNSEIDWQQKQKEILTLGEILPKANNREAQSIANMLLTELKAKKPEYVADYLSALSESKNSAFREVSRSKSVLEKARSTPLKLEFTDLNGNDIALKQFRGQAVLLDFGAYSWCGICKLERPRIHELYEKYRSQGFEVLGISVEGEDFSDTELKNLIADEGISWPHWNVPGGMNNQFVTQLNLFGVPEYMLLDKEGLLIWQRSQSDNGGLQNLEPVLRKVLNLPPLKQAP